MELCLIGCPGLDFQGIGVELDYVVISVGGVDGTEVAAITVYEDLSEENVTSGYGQKLVSHIFYLLL